MTKSLMFFVKCGIVPDHIHAQSASIHVNYFLRWIRSVCSHQLNLGDRRSSGEGIPRQLDRSPAR